MEDKVKQNKYKWDTFADRAQYIEKQETPVLLRIDTDCNLGNLSKIRVDITSLEEKMKQITQIEWVPVNEKQTALVNCGVYPVGGYGVEVYQEDQLVCATAFDVVNSFGENLRYGFLSRFSEEDADEADILYANKLHLNMLQFYDWMYRHDQLVPPTEKYKNPLNCAMSKDVIIKKTADCKKYGIKPYAYGAIYAAGKDFYEEHKDWALYHFDKEAMIFADWLVYMNCTKGSGWDSYITSQYKEVIQEMGFLGIHMDTYGYPKSGWDYQNRLVRLEETFPGLINESSKAVKEVDPEARVIFNAVNDWPVEAITKTDQVGIYIEVWPPHNTYRDLYLLIQKAGMLSGKEVILAAYMKPFQTIAQAQDYKKAEKASLLAFAVIHASGGHQLAYGEDGGVLVDGYYVEYAKLREEFLPVIRAYHDFIVRYSQLLYAKDAFDISMTAADGINEDILFSSSMDGAGFSSWGEAGKIWCQIREWRHYAIINMINLVGENDKWNEAKTGELFPVTGIKISILMEKPVYGVWYASPDDVFCRRQQLNYQIINKKEGRRVEIEVPTLMIWGLVWIDYSTNKCETI